MRHKIDALQHGSRGLPTTRWLNVTRKYRPVAPEQFITNCFYVQLNAGMQFATGKTRLSPSSLHLPAIQRNSSFSMAGFFQTHNSVDLKSCWIVKFNPNPIMSQNRDIEISILFKRLYRLKVISVSCQRQISPHFPNSSSKSPPNCRPTLANIEVARILR